MECIYTKPDSMESGTRIHQGFNSLGTFHNFGSVIHLAVKPSVIENAQRHFQGSSFGCFEYVPYTALTIVLIIKTINVRLD